MSNCNNRSRRSKRTSSRKEAQKDYRLEAVNNDRSTFDHVMKPLMVPGHKAVVTDDDDNYLDHHLGGH